MTVVSWTPVEDFNGEMVGVPSVETEGDAAGATVSAVVTAAKEAVIKTP